MGDENTTTELTARERLEKAITTLHDALELRKSQAPTAVTEPETKTSTEIIGHAGTPAEGVHAGQHPFGANPDDHSNPGGTSVMQTTERGVEAGAEGRIQAARARSRDGGASRNDNSALLAGTGPLVKSEAVADALVKSDDFVEAIDASPALEHLGNVFAKSVDSIVGMIEQRMNAIDQRLAAIESLNTASAEGTVALAKSLTEGVAAVSTTEELSKAGSQPAVRQPMSGIGVFAPSIFAPQTRRTGELPEGMTKSMVNSGLQKAVHDGLITESTYALLGTRMDTMQLNDFWTTALAPNVQKAITENN